LGIPRDSDRRGLFGRHDLLRAETGQVAINH
jgi:hypothetical protein